MIAPALRGKVPCDLRHFFVLYTPSCIKARISVTSVHVMVDVGVKKMDLNEGTGRMGEVKTCCHTLYPEK